MYLFRFSKYSFSSQFSIRILLLVAFVFAFMPDSARAGELDLVRFRVENRDSTSISIRLYSQDGSGTAYYMVIEGTSTKVMTPQAGVYDYRLSSCGVVVRGEIDLSRKHNWILPSCGNKGGPGTQATNTTDASEIVRLVKIDLVNEKSTRIADCHTD